MWRLINFLSFFIASTAMAGSQAYESLSVSTRTVLQRTVSDRAVPMFVTLSDLEARNWLDSMMKRLEKRISEIEERKAFLMTVHYEATRAGLDPELVLSIIQVESNFRKYAVSSAGARGYMQVMPFWVDLIGSQEHNLFHLRVNLRYGCTILRHYLDLEKGDYFRALGRYNGSLGKADYPNLVFNAWHRHWTYSTVSQ
ncbi:MULTISPECIES: lytic transglycosylase domain-containing protein [Nitrosomonas]|uniref:lytic transglycosylase domain-containing protein n=1 Tax=Nitrosomonas TaxID=914 RepID=UPI0008904784|nr:MULTISPECIES: lytic transglycosylase domain-containing protein [Nitrosomonas]MXS79960.1 lytic transglycosylase domain-containing protein [Nitrosomonas sp. GH22]SCX28040.1 Transglycosylase SLT domain-containing protein [Nitrosomonas eutropha]SDW01288.1 Transglycosylase SLT domain-containing protein [Nitrosomonas eutropha]SEJ19824.1 Transglycosylase SLT domain-containing protein [Nitrosomonas eutropha]